MSSHRLDNFTGTTEQYVAYLEALVLEARVVLDGQSHNLSSPPPSPVPSTTRPCGLRFALFDPATIAPAKSPPQWQAELAKLLNEVPAVVVWEDTRREIGLGVSDNDMHVMAQLLGVSTLNWSANAPANSIVETTSQKSPLLQSARFYAEFTGRFLTFTQLTRNLGFFQQLIVASLCAVLEGNKVPTEDVDAIMSLCVSEKSLYRYRLGAVWVNRQISSLFFQGWGHRASELFLLCGCYKQTNWIVARY